MLELSIVVVTWNCRDLALRCLRTITAATEDLSREIIVVDNASTDGTPAAVQADFPSVLLICNSVNAGYAAANNAGLARATGRYWLLLNPDAFPAGAAVITGLLAYLSANPTVGAVAPRLRHEDGRHQVGDAGFAPTLRTLAVHALSLMRVSTSWHGVFVTRVGAAASCDVDWLCGACLMVRAEAGREVGLLDESFFMYGEDIEWGCRMRDQGWRVVYLPRIEVLHLGAGTQPATPGAFSTKWLDGLSEIYLRRNGDRGIAVLRATLVIGFGGRALVYGLASLMPGRRLLRHRARAMACYASHGLRLRGRSASG